MFTDVAPRTIHSTSHHAIHENIVINNISWKAKSKCIIICKVFILHLFTCVASCEHVSYNKIDMWVSEQASVSKLRIFLIFVLSLSFSSYLFILWLWAESSLLGCFTTLFAVCEILKGNRLQREMFYRSFISDILHMVHLSTFTR